MSPTQSSKLQPAIRIGLILAMIVAALSATAGEPAAPAPASPTLRRGLAAEAAAQALTEAPSESAEQVPTPGQPLDLEALVRIALDTNPLVRAAQEGVATARESVGVARASYYPEVGVDARYRRFDTHVFLPAGLPVSTTTLGSTDDWTAGVRAGYTLFDSGQRSAERDAAVAGEKAAGHDAARVRQDVAFSVHQAYYRVLSALAARSAAEMRLARSRDHVELARARKAAGAAPQSDVLRAEVELADGQLALVSAEGAVRVAYGNLNTTLGLPVDLPLEFNAPEEGFLRPGDEGTKAALVRALQQRPELQASRERIAAADREVAAIRGVYGPRVKAEGAFGWRDSTFLPQDQDWSVGFSFNIPLFTGFARAHRVARAATEVRALEAEMAALAARIQQEVWTANSDLVEADQAVRQSEVLRGAAQESLRFARARYEAGASTITDLLDAESALTQADAAHLTAGLGFRVASARLLRAEGGL